jgi:UPF0288 family protein (methanogenesis marker protein 3)
LIRKEGSRDEAGIDVQTKFQSFFSKENVEYIPKPTSTLKPEDRGSICLRNIGNIAHNHTVQE